MKKSMAAIVMAMVVGTFGLSVSSGGEGQKQKEITNTVGVKMVLIRPGSFLMGSTVERKRGQYYEGPVHRVKLTRGFYMGVTEVTQGQWFSVMKANPSRYKGTNRPVERVTLDDCVEFCKLLTRQERAQGKLPEGAEYRLPTEAEWEYACRAGSKTKYCFGDSETELGEYAWYRENSGRSHPVGTRKANAWGLFDMHGNVHEWCGDWFAIYSAGETNDPTGAPPGPSYKGPGFRGGIFRGGSWGSTANHCRSAARNDCYGRRGFSGVGFRLVRTLPGQ